MNDAALLHKFCARGLGARSFIAVRRVPRPQSDRGYFLLALPTVREGALMIQRRPMKIELSTKFMVSYRSFC